MNTESATSRESGRPNRLSREKSPYLLQHAHNPVNWFPWGDEAFDEARRQGKPVFLSIGYATCHWCHVMERESFSDPEVARLINGTFVPVKVDREERPDVDHVYMTVCQSLTGQGGWPLTVMLTPDREPFFAGTYFPKRGRPGLPGLLELIPQVHRLWLERHDEVVDNAAEITAAVREAALDSSAGFIMAPTTALRAFSQLKDRYDAAAGGFGTAPKFPTPHNFTFLTRFWKRTGDPAALDMVRESLRRMRRGGLYDQIGFGFHRYSTDAEWRLPHFEKMLYDQALLSVAYLEAFQATGDPDFRRTAEEIFEYVERDMRDPGGAYYSAEDADSEGVEGKFYLWHTSEIRNALPRDDAERVIACLNLADAGNFRDPHQHTPAGSNVPYLHPDRTSPDVPIGTDGRPLVDWWNRIRPVLLKMREERPRPIRDDKILADWNGLMAAALATGARVLDRPVLAEAAARTLDFVIRNMSRADGRLYHRHRSGDSAIDGQLDDYAFVSLGLLETYQSTGQARYLEHAIRLTDLALELFWDADTGGFFMTPADGEQLLFRVKETYDGAIPSGNSVSLENLLRLAAITGRVEYSAMADRLTRGFAGAVDRMPSAYTRLLGALENEAAQVFVCRDRSCQRSLGDPDELARFLERG